MRVRRTLALLLALATLPLAAGSEGSDDAGGPGDAPDTWTGARNVAASFSGTFTSGDPADWFRFIPPAGMSLHVRLDPAANFSGGLQAVDDTGRNLSVSRYVYWQRDLTIRVPPDVGAVRIGIFPDELGPYAVTLTLYAPADQDDAGLGDDAPAIRDEAFEITARSFSGELRPGLGDGEDWYRLVLPAERALRVILTTDRPDMYVTVANDWGGAISHAEERTQVGVPADGVIRIGVRYPLGSGVNASYQVTLEIGPLPDIRVSVSVAAEHLPFETTREVILDLTNVGGDADEVHVWANAIQRSSLGGTQEAFGFQVIALDAGATHTVALSWETIGRVGYFEMEGCAMGLAEAQREDNSDSTSGWIGPMLPGFFAADPEGFLPARLGKTDSTVPIGAIPAQWGRCVE